MPFHEVCHNGKLLFHPLHHYDSNAGPVAKSGHCIGQQVNIHMAATHHKLCSSTRDCQCLRQPDHWHLHKIRKQTQTDLADQDLSDAHVYDVAPSSECSSIWRCVTKLLTTVYNIECLPA